MKANKVFPDKSSNNLIMKYVYNIKYMSSEANYRVMLISSMRLDIVVVKITKIFYANGKFKYEITLITLMILWIVDVLDSYVMYAFNGIERKI